MQAPMLRQNSNDSFQGKKSRFYVVVPMPLVAVIEVQTGEFVRWTLTNKQTLQIILVFNP